MLPIGRRAMTLFRQLECESDHSLGALPSNDAAVHREFLHSAPVKKAAGRRIEPLGVLPNDHEVHSPGLPHELEAVVDLVPDVRVELGRSHVRVQVQAEPQSEHDADARDVPVRQDRLREPNGTEEDRIRGLTGFECAVGPLLSGVEVMLTTAGKWNKVERDAIRRLDGLQDLDAFPQHLRSDAVPRESPYADSTAFRTLTPSRSTSGPTPSPARRTILGAIRAAMRSARLKVCPATSQRGLVRDHVGENANSSIWSGVPASTSGRDRRPRESRARSAGAAWT